MLTLWPSGQGVGLRNQRLQVRVLPGSLIPKPYIGCAYMLTANPVATHTAKQMLIQKCGRLSHRRENGGGSQSCATQYNGACPPSLLAATPGQLEAWHYEADFVGCANLENIMCRRLIRWPVGLMDKASAPGAGYSRFESWAGQLVLHWFLLCLRWSVDAHKLCRDPGSNRGPSDLRSDALPAELSRLQNCF